MSQAASGQHGRQTRTYKEIAAQLKAECRRTIDLQHRADRAEKAERSLTIELQRARERIAVLEAQIADLTARRDRVAASFGGTVAVIARLQARSG